MGIGDDMSMSRWLIRSVGKKLYLVPPEDPDSEGLLIGYVDSPLAADEIARRWNAGIRT